MSCEQKCTNCELSRFVKFGESFRHRWGMNAVNKGAPFYVRSCTTAEEKSFLPDPVCDKPEEFREKVEVMVEV